MSDFYALLGVSRDRGRGRDQEGLPQARDGVPPRPEQGARRRGEVQGDHRGLRGAPRSAEARRLRPLRQGRAWAAGRAGRLPSRGPVRGAQHLHARLRRDGRLRVALRRRPRGRTHRRGQDVRVTVKLTLGEVATGVKKNVKLKTLDRCQTCCGLRRQARHRSPTTCTTCGGSRRGAPRGPQHVRAVRVGLALSHLRRRGHHGPAGLRGLPRRRAGARASGP